MNNTNLKKARLNITIKAVATTLILATAFVSTHGQETENPETAQKPKVKITTVTTSEETTDWGYDRKNSRSRVGMSGAVKLPGKTKSLKSTTTISQMIDIKIKKAKLFCESDIDLEYYQKNTETEVRTLFTSQNCAEYDAIYQLRISYFDSNGKIQRINSNEEWPVGRTEQVRKSFPMEPNSELRRVSSHIVSCTCRDAQ